MDTNFEDAISKDIAGNFDKYSKIIEDFNIQFKNELNIVKTENKFILKIFSVDINKLEMFKKTHNNRLINQIYDIIVNIKAYGIKNGKRIFVGYNKDIKVKNKDINKSKRTTFFYVKQNFNNKNNELSESEVNKIICADSEEYLKTLPDNCIDLIFTSPPYNFGMEYETHDDSIVWNDYFKKMDAIITECVRVLKFGGRIAFNVQPLFSEYIPTHHIFSNMFMKHNLIWKAEIIWEKNNYNAKYTSWGSWKSPSSPYFKYTWEFVEVYCKGDLKKEGKSENSDITADEFKKWTVGKWSIAPERGMKLYNHPAMFPEELATRVIKMFSFINDVVLDPFNGAGTTTHIAHKLNRKYIGVDISKEYCKTAKRRITSKISDYYE